MGAFSCNVCGQGFDFGGCGCDSLPDSPILLYRKGEQCPECAWVHTKDADECTGCRTLAEAPRGWAVV